MYSLHISKYIFKINRFFSTSKHFRSHYDTLNVKRNCTAKEIRDSFIRLSKEHHPDLNKNRNAHRKFLEINEAYKILSNAESRRNYDLGLAPSGTTNIHYREWPNADPWKDPSFYHNRQKTHDDYYSDHKSYYGIKGIKRVSNSTFVMFCLSIATIAVFLQFLAIRKSFTFQRDFLKEKSKQAEDTLKNVRNTAALNGNEVQLELLKMRLANKEKPK